MTCHELRLFFDDPMRQDDELRAELEHLAHCVDCARFVAAQRELGNSLRLVREAVPQLPAALDAAVLTGYRRHLGGQHRAVVQVRGKRSLALLRWGAAAAAILLTAALLYRLEHRAEPTAVRTLVSPPAVTVPARVTAQVAKDLPGTRRTRRTATDRHTVPSASAAAVNALPAGFRSLMFCDELSCGEALEVIRVQLPSSAGALAASGGQPVFADVLVGPDGIARGIRVVE
ncbi:MAG TPA: hypothetical protein VKB77_17375 [Terriglobales bacterium]|nr:hypothetical protein [Terriglobales bacterium]